MAIKQPVAVCKYVGRSLPARILPLRRIFDFSEKLFLPLIGTPLAKRKIAPFQKSCGGNHQPNKIMSLLTAKGNWNIAKGKLKQKFAQLTDDACQFVEGKRDELTGRIQKRTGRRTNPAGGECCGCRH